MLALFLLGCTGKYVEQEPIRFDHVVKFLINEGSSYAFYYDDGDLNTPLEKLNYGNYWPPSFSLQWSLDNQDEDPYVIVHWSWWSDTTFIEQCHFIEPEFQYINTGCAIYSGIELHTSEDVSSIQGGVWNHGKFGHGNVNELW